MHTHTHRIKYNFGEETGWAVGTFVKEAVQYDKTKTQIGLPNKGALLFLYDNENLPWPHLLNDLEKYQDQECEQGWYCHDA